MTLKVCPQYAYIVYKYRLHIVFYFYIITMGDHVLMHRENVKWKIKILSTLQFSNPQTIKY